MSISRQARITRTAISPRLATRTLLNNALPPFGCFRPSDPEATGGPYPQCSFNVSITQWPDHQITQLPKRGLGVKCNLFVDSKRHSGFVRKVCLLGRLILPDAVLSLPHRTCIGF